ncbi:MAG: YbjN domain-containing protein [Chitinophagales bacterium]
MGQIFETILEFFEDNDWQVDLVDFNLLRTAFFGKNGKFDLYGHELTDKEGILFHCRCPVNVPESKRVEVAEFLTRANFEMLLGNFEMDWEDGEVRYKTSLYTNDEAATVAMVEPLVWSNVYRMDQYFPGLMSIIYGNLSPKEAIDMVETEDEAQNEVDR